jgi:hypothetical protein
VVEHDHEASIRIRKMACPPITSKQPYRAAVASRQLVCDHVSEHTVSRGVGRPHADGPSLVLCTTAVSANDEPRCTTVPEAILLSRDRSRVRTNDLRSILHRSLALGNNARQP